MRRRVEGTLHPNEGKCGRGLAPDGGGSVTDQWAEDRYRGQAPSHIELTSLRARVRFLVADREDAGLIRADKHIKIAHFVLLQLRLLCQRGARQFFKARLLCGRQRLLAE